MVGDSRCADHMSLCNVVGLPNVAQSFQAAGPERRTMLTTNRVVQTSRNTASDMLGKTLGSVVPG